MAGEDPEYLAWIRKQPCAVVTCKCPAELGPTQAHHHTRGGPLGKRGKSQKSHDHEAMPLCMKCHRRLHALAGPFAGWGKVQLYEWQDARAREYRERFTDTSVF